MKRWEIILLCWMALTAGAGLCACIILAAILHELQAGALRPEPDPLTIQNAPHYQLLVPDQLEPWLVDGDFE